MRKYRLAQQRSDTEESAPPSAVSAAPRAPPARPARPASCCCCARPAREVRSLGASRSELRPQSPASPPRGRLDPHAHRDMLRAAMRNSYERAPRASPRGGTEGSLIASPCTAREPSRPLSLDTTPPYDVLEIIVSETLHAPPSAPRTAAPTPAPAVVARGDTRHLDIDEYVSNILVESLNSLTDQLECIGRDRHMSVVEKEIKVKLQNAGVNTVVHLSPTSNHQIIFGNEELYHDEARREPRDENALSIREEPPSAESNENRPSAEHPTAASPSPYPCDPFDIHHDDVDRSVLQQIQKLFQDELRSLAPDESATADRPEVSHVDISDVDAFIEGAEAALVERDLRQAYGGVGAGNYYPDAGERPVVPRFSAMPHTDSMEVHASSSDDLGGSDCTSLVDSLDDPNSPRYPSSRRPRSGRRTELARSAVAVLDLLPERAAPTPRDKPESFFIDIADDERGRAEENVTVAERMPEVIKQRLHRRHRKREQRMESARRSRARPQRRERAAERARRAALERDCAALVGALVDDVIAKVTLDEYRSARVQRRPAVPADGATSVKRTWRRRPTPTDRREPFKASKNCATPPDSGNGVEPHRVHAKLSLRPPRPEERVAKRLYQKSEIREGDRCIEILEIVECGATSHSSTDTIHSDENQNICTKNKKSRIPVPVTERAPRQGAPPDEGADSVELNGNERTPPRASPRRASLPFRRVFAPIPEEPPNARRASLACLPSAPRDTRSVATSPMSEGGARHQGTMTSPRSRSAATSPRAPAPPPPAGTLLMSLHRRTAAHLVRVE